jgi:hypothetical protein
MKLTQKLIGFLNSVFNPDPVPFLALRIQYGLGSFTWAVTDEVLTLTTVSGSTPVLDPSGNEVLDPVTGLPILNGVPGATGALEIDLTAYTLSTLAAYVAALPGFTVLNLTPVLSGLSACVLLDASGDQDLSNGDHLYGYTDPLWAYFDAAARQLHIQKGVIAAMPAQMSIPTSSGEWLDYLGSFYDVPRNTGEIDPVYAPRMVAQAFAPKGNNIAIENAILAATGQAASVTDVVSYTVNDHFDGTYIFDGTINYGDATVAYYNLFDVTYAFDLINGVTSDYSASIVALVERVRDAGTHLRHLVLGGSALVDDFPNAPTEAGDILVLTTSSGAITETIEG